MTSKKEQAHKKTLNHQIFFFLQIFYHFFSVVKTWESCYYASLCHFRVSVFFYHFLAQCQVTIFRLHMLEKKKIKKNYYQVFLTHLLHRIRTLYSKYFCFDVNADVNRRNLFYNLDLKLKKKKNHAYIFSFTIFLLSLYSLISIYLSKCIII